MIDNDFSTIREKVVMILTTLIIYFFNLFASYTVSYCYVFMRFERTEIVDRLSLPHDGMKNINSR